MLLKLAVVVLLTAFQSPNTDPPSDGVEVTERYTLRVKQPGRSGKPEVRALAISPDGKQVAVATSRELLFARSTDGEIQSRINYSPFSMAYSNDSRQLLTINERASKMFQVAPPAEIPSSFNRPQGYLGVKLEEKNGKLVVATVEPGSPASKYEKIKGAEIVGIGEGNGTTIESVIGKSLKRVLPMLDGPANTKVTFSIIPRGKIDELDVTMPRMLIMPSGEYKPLPIPKQAEAVAWCMVNDFHEFRNSRNGGYVSSIRCEQIENNQGAQAISKDGQWFAFISEYKNEESATVEIAESNETETENDEPQLVNGPASHKVGYEQGAREIYGTEIYNVLTQELVASFPIGKDESRRSGKIFIGVQLDPATNRMIVGTSSTIHIYNVGTGERTSTIRPVPSDDSITYTSIALAGDFVAVGDTLGVVRIVNLKTKQLVETIPSREKRSVTHVDFSKDAKVLTYHADGVAHVVHLKTAN